MGYLRPAKRVEVEVALSVLVHLFILPRVLQHLLPRTRAHDQFRCLLASCPGCCCCLLLPRVVPRICRCHELQRLCFPLVSFYCCCSCSWVRQHSTYLRHCASPRYVAFLEAQYAQGTLATAAADFDFTIDSAHFQVHWPKDATRSPPTASLTSSPSVYSGSQPQDTTRNGPPPVRYTLES